MKTIKKYSTVIICVLILLLTGKSCQSCSRGNQIEYNKALHAQIEDSLTHKIISLENDLLYANDSIKLLNSNLKAARELNGFAMSSLEHARQTNKTLVNQLENKTEYIYENAY